MNIEIDSVGVDEDEGEVDDAVDVGIDEYEYDAVDEGDADAGAGDEVAV